MKHEMNLLWSTPPPELRWNEKDIIEKENETIPTSKLIMDYEETLCS